MVLYNHLPSNLWYFKNTKLYNKFKYLLELIIRSTHSLLHRKMIYITRKIPSQIGLLKDLQILDLKNSHLITTIPSSIKIFQN